MLRRWYTINGKEFALQQDIAKALDAIGYFAHPYPSWERGLNENTNCLIRQYFPKGQDLLWVSDAEVQQVMDKLNNRPRTCLGFKTSNQVFLGINPPVALASWIRVSILLIKKALRILLI